MGTDRAEYVAGLRALADLLEAHDELPLPYDGTGSPLSIHLLGNSDPRADMATFVRLVGGSFEKSTYGEGAYFQVTGAIAGLKVSATAYRSKVCTRVVKGTREVTEEVPDPAALAAVPKVTVTKTVEDVEWDCAPILAEQVAS